MSHAHAFSCPDPPLCPWGEKHAVFWDTKITLDLALSYRVGKTVRSVRRIAVNRDPFHKLRCGKHQEFLVPLRRRPLARSASQSRP